MYFDSKKVVEFCSKTKINIEQLLLITLLYKNDIANIMRYGHQIRTIKKEELEGLVKKGILLNNNRDGEYLMEEFALTSKFNETFGIVANDLAQELFDIYPSTIVVGTTKFKSRNIGPEALQEIIDEKIIKGRIKPKDFAFITEALKEQIVKGEVGMGLKAWVDTEQWLSSNVKIAELGNDL